jgi:hypothetical protein
MHVKSGTRQGSLTGPAQLPRRGLDSLCGLCPSAKSFACRKIKVVSVSFGSCGPVLSSSAHPPAIKVRKLWICYGGRTPTPDSRMIHPYTLDPSVPWSPHWEFSCTVDEYPTLFPGAEGQEICGTCPISLCARNFLFLCLMLEFQIVPL